MATPEKRPAEHESALLWSGLDTVTADLLVDLLTAQSIQAAAVAHGFDGVTVGHTARDVEVHVPVRQLEAARACVQAAWGEEAVEKLDARR